MARSFIQASSDADKAERDTEFMIPHGECGQRMPAARMGPPRTRSSHHDEIVLFEVQLLIRHDKDFGGAFALQRFKALPFLVLKKAGDRRMGTHDDPLLFVSSADFSDLAEDLICHRRRRLGIPSAFAVSAWFGERT